MYRSVAEEEPRRPHGNLDDHGVRLRRKTVVHGRDAAERVVVERRAERFRVDHDERRRSDHGRRLLGPAAAQEPGEAEPRSHRNHQQDDLPDVRADADRVEQRNDAVQSGVERGVRNEADGGTADSRCRGHTETPIAPILRPDERHHEEADCGETGNRSEFARSTNGLLHHR